MKTSFVRQCSIGLAAGLTFFLGCARPSAEPEQPRSVIAPAAPPIAVVAQPPLIPTSSANAEPTRVTEADTNAPAIVERIPPSTTPDNVSLSTGLSEVVKLAQAGVNEDVILAYVEKYAGQFNVGSEQILYLNDLGVSSAVITSMLKHDGSEASVASLPGVPLPSNAQTQVVSNVPENPVVEPPMAPVSTTVAPPPSTGDAAYFYDSLSPYGSWLYLANYGWCWQPTVAVSAGAWRPYSDRGRWYWSDAGWYWNSDYSWGWAPFHYGRWYCHPNSGWVWTPGRVWAPSWVSWRYSAGYCGWAPLPPEAHFVSGVGFTYHSRHVSVGFDFGLTDFHYSFVSINNFCDYAPYHHFVARSNVKNVYRNTTVVNNYIVGNNNTVINRGVGRETIARSNPNRIREVSVRDVPARNISKTRVDHVERQGNQSVVFRPQLPSTPPSIKTTQIASRQNGQAPVSVGRVSGAGVTAGNRNNNGAQPATVSRTPASSGRTAAGSITDAGRNAQTSQGRPAVNPRVTPNVSDQRTSGRENTPNNKATTPYRVQPRSEVNTPLFGDVPRTSPQASASAPRSVATPSTTTSRIQTQQQQPRYVAPSTPSSARTYSPSSTVSPATPSVRSETRSVTVPTYSPRHREQTPHVPGPNNYSAPRTPSAPAAATAPRTQVRSSVSNGGGGGRGESGGRDRGR